MKCHLIIDTVSMHHDIQTYTECLRKRGVLHCVGGVPEPVQYSQLKCMFNNLTITGSIIGGIKATRDCVE